MSSYPTSRIIPNKGIKGRFSVLAAAYCMGYMMACLSVSCVWGSPDKGGKLEGTTALSTQVPSRSATSVGAPCLSDEIPDEEENIETFLDENGRNKAGSQEDGSALIEWRESYGDQCYKSKRNRGFCQGPRRVPKAYGTEAALAQELGLGEHRTMYRLLAEAPEPSWVAAAGAKTNIEKLLWPIPEGKVLRGYGKVGKGRNRHLHKGIDIGAEEGTLFYAVTDGIVAYSDNAIRGYGNLLAVVHPDRSVALYSHARALYLFAGQMVRRGQVLGEVGHTGFAQCSHLHFEYRIKGRPTDLQGKFAEY
jgi:hypothetical protein